MGNLQVRFLEGWAPAMASGYSTVVEFVTIASIIGKLRAKTRETQPGFWIDGYFFDDTKVKDKRQLNVHDLDQVSKDHPVVVHHRGGHTSFYNTKARSTLRPLSRKVSIIKCFTLWDHFKGWRVVVRISSNVGKCLESIEHFMSGRSAAW